MSQRKKSNRKPSGSGNNKQTETGKNNSSGFWASAFTRDFNLTAILIICIVGFLAYSNTFSSEMQFDDGLQIVRKDLVNDFSNFTSVSAWSEVNKRPLSNFTFALNYYSGGYQVKGYHIVNLLIHLISAILVFFISISIFGTVSKNKTPGSPDYKHIAALFTALLFVAHPLQTQAVTYIVQRMTSLSAMFYLLALLLYALGRAQHLGGKMQKALLFYAATLLAAIFSLLSKQIAVTIPFALLLYEYFFIRNKQGKPFYRYIITSLTVLIIGAVYVLFSGLLPSETEDISRYQYLITQSRVVVKYFQLLVLPINQNVDYSFPLSESIWGWKELLSVFFLIGILGLAITLIKKRPVSSFGIFWIFLTLSVESSFIPIRDVIFEHRLYLPMFGFALIISDLVFHFFGSKKTKPAIILLSSIIILLSITTFTRNKVWQTQYTLWADAMAKSPDKTRPLYNLAYLHNRDGQHAKAVQYAKKALELDPQDEHAYYVAAVSSEKAGNIDQAITYYKKGILLDTTARQAMNNLGSIYLNRKNYKEAVKYFSMALDNSRKQSAVLRNLVTAYVKLNDYNNTIKYAKIYLRKEPDDVSVLTNLGDSYLYLSQTKHAIKIYNQILKLAPKKVRTYNNLGTCYYYESNYKKAAYYYKEALKIDPTNKNAKQYLSMTKKYLVE